MSLVRISGTGSFQGSRVIDNRALFPMVKSFDRVRAEETVRKKGNHVDELDAAQVDTLASLPSREVLLATLLGVLQAPASKLVRTLNEPGASLARVLAAKEA